MAVGVLVALSGCGGENGHADLEWQLSQRTLDSFEEAQLKHPEAAEAHLLGALEMLFGTPQAPRYLLTEEAREILEDEGIDPWNAGGDWELSEEEREAFKRDNRERRFKLQFQQLALRNYDAVPEPRYAADLWKRWLTRFEPLHTGVRGEDGEFERDESGKVVRVDPDSKLDPEDEESWTWHKEAEYLFESHYPTLRESAEMYRMQCLHCHGSEGGGDGPTAPYLDPRPRDYRLGKFKFMPVENGKRPRRQDLVHRLQEGVTFTSMPSFARFSRAQVEGLADYVRLLAMRGEVELLLALEITDNGDLPPEAVMETYLDIRERWETADEGFVGGDVAVPPVASITQANIDRGRELFLSEKAACATCHGEDGRGRGEALYEYEEVKDVNGEVVLDDEGAPVLRVARLKPDDWGNPSAPRNFRNAIFRGGSRPIDLYRRIRTGITGTIMPGNDQLTDEEIWDLVYYVKSIANEFDIATVYRHKQERLAAHADEEHAEVESGDSD
jgi:mono/diheme cytochrome c family protein